jgi:hypothetical protein
MANDLWVDVVRRVADYMLNEANLAYSLRLILEGVESNLKSYNDKRRKAGFAPLFTSVSLGANIRQDKPNNKYGFYTKDSYQNCLSIKNKDQSVDVVACRYENPIERNTLLHPFQIEQLYPVRGNDSTVIVIKLYRYE